MAESSSVVIARETTTKSLAEDSAARRTRDATQTAHKAPITRRIRPTNATYYLLLVLLFILLGAVNYQSNAAYLVLAVVMSTAVMSLLHGWRNLSGIRLTPGRTFPVFAGEPLRAQVTLIGSARDHWTLVIDAPEVAEDEGIPFAHLPAHGSATIELVLPGRRRGVHRLTRVRVGSMHPLGLLVLSLEVPAEWTWVVYPRPLPGGCEADGGDETVVGQQSASIGDFAGHRSYRQGEPHRRVDWRAVARGRPLLVKDYASGGRADDWIAWDDDPVTDVELHLSLLAGRVIEAERQGLRYGLRLPQATIVQGSGPDHRHACLQALALHGSGT